MKRILLTILLLTVASPVWAVTQWSKSIPVLGDSKSAWPGQVTAQWSIMDTLLSNYRQGENLTYKNSTTITVTLGQVVVSNLAGSLRLFLNDSGNTDITSANLDTGGSFSAGTTYYVYAGTTSGTAASSTYYISLSSSAPTGPTYYFQLGYFTTNSSGLISNIVNNNLIGLGASTSKSSGVVYQALTDGYVVSIINTGGGNNSHGYLYADSSNPPTTIISEVGSDSSVSGPNGVIGTLYSPVRRGDYYKITVDGFASFIKATFIPSGS